MRSLTAQEILRVWDAGMGRSRTERALLLLATACPEISRDELAALPVGRRDDRLLALRESTLGSTLSSRATCPSCGEELELSFTAGDVRGPAPGDDGPLSIEAHGYEVVFRLPTSADLEDLEGVDDKAARLFQRCVRTARRAGKERQPGRLPGRVRDAVVQRMSEADPQADVEAAVECPSCEHTWRATFDIVSFFWRELESRVYQAMREVHALASAYGWSESEVLALSPWRRRHYIQLAHP